MGGQQGWRSGYPHLRCTDSGVEPTNCGSDKLDAVHGNAVSELGVYNIASVYSYFVLGIIKFLLLLLLSPQDASPLSKLSLTLIRDIERVTGVDFFNTATKHSGNENN